MTDEVKNNILVIGDNILAYYYNEKLLKYSRSLRKNMTKEEQALWYKCLRTLPFTVNRQKPIGEYIVDFYCSTTRTAIELDGSQHFDEAAIEYDRKRDEYLSGLGITVLRYSNHDVNTNFQGVCDDILRKFNLIE